MKWAADWYIFFSVQDTVSSVSLCGVLWQEHIPRAPHFFTTALAARREAVKSAPIWLGALWIWHPRMLGKKSSWARNVSYPVPGKITNKPSYSPCICLHFVTFHYFSNCDVIPSDVEPPNNEGIGVNRNESLHLYFKLNVSKYSVIRTLFTVFCFSTLRVKWFLKLKAILTYFIIYIILYVIICFIKNIMTWS